MINDIYNAFRDQKSCYEMTVQRNISQIFEHIYHKFDFWPKSEVSRIQFTTQIRIQKMLTDIYDHYADTVRLEDLAAAANISKSEAGRCFRTYMGCSPVEALIQYCLQMAHRLLNETTLTLQEISCDCGFRSVNYFSCQVRKK